MILNSGIWPNLNNRLSNNRLSNNHLSSNRFKKRGKMNDFDLLTTDEYRRLIQALGGQELFVSQQGNELLTAILGDKADEFIKRFRGDRICIKKTRPSQSTAKAMGLYLCGQRYVPTRGKSIAGD